VRDLQEEERGGSRGIIVVNGTGSGDYTRIQWAIDNASKGDTVYVEPGTYRENVVVDKKIALIGANRNTTIIVGNGDDDTVTITADHVRVKNFAIRNSGRFEDGIKIDEAELCIIKNNNCSNLYYGIFLDRTKQVSVVNNICNDNDFGMGIYSSDDNRISGNNISFNGNRGIYASSSDNNDISENNCSNNYRGIELDNSCNNVLSKNTILDNWVGIKIVGEFSGSNNNILTYNHVRANRDGIYVSGSSGMIFSNNDIKYNELSGLDIGGSDHQIINNSVCHNNIANAYFYAGINLASERTVITGNLISFNGIDGISGGGRRCIISDNIINNNSRNGIDFQWLYQSEITNNTISFNKCIAIYLGGILSYISVRNNIIEQGGIYLNSYFADNLLTLAIDSTNTINGKQLYFMKNNTGEIVPPDAGQVILVNCKNVIVENQNISNCYVGIQVVISTDCTIINNTLINNSHAGIEIFGTDYIPDPDYPCERNLVMNNTCISNMNGIYLFRADENEIEKNTLIDNFYYGIQISDDCENNEILACRNFQDYNS